LVIPVLASHIPYGLQPSFDRPNTEALRSLVRAVKDAVPASARFV
jgi:hypothetical protein